jgi:hypothetical protein
MTTAPTMTEAELDTAYTHLCRTMTGLGEARASLFLARFALLAMVRIGDPAALQRLTDSAAADIADG